MVGVVARTASSCFAAGALERVVGSNRSRKMLKNTDTPTYMFC
jgi:preprotein translocase subunit SecF